MSPAVWLRLLRLVRTLAFVGATVVLVLAVVGAVLFLVVGLALGEIGHGGASGNSHRDAFAKLALIVIANTCCPFSGIGILLLVSGLIVQLFVRRGSRLDRVSQGCCVKCGYDLRGNPTSTACPECGTAVRRAGADGQ